MKKFEKGIEKLFFKGNETKWSSWLSYMIVDVILMVLIFYIILNTLFYDFTGSIYPPGTGFRLNYLGDDFIPFIPQMVIFYYYLFYPMTIISMVYFAFIVPKKGYAFAWSLVIINLIACIIYLFFPVSTYLWREQILANASQYQGNFFAQVVFGIFNSDTSFNCFPSLHAAVSTITFYAWYRYYKRDPNLIKLTVVIVTFIIAAGVILSTLFVKQHYILDEIAGILLAYLVGRFIFNWLWKSSNQQIKSE
ncbi:MAG: phosphatase PAP2 family protein [Candidatus Lokiarchaeota archaeon]